MEEEEGGRYSKHCYAFLWSEGICPDCITASRTVNNALLSAANQLLSSSSSALLYSPLHFKLKYPPLFLFTVSLLFLTCLYCVVPSSLSASFPFFLTFRCLYFTLNLTLNGSCVCLCVCQCVRVLLICIYGIVHNSGEIPWLSLSSTNCAAHSPGSEPGT